VLDEELQHHRDQHEQAGDVGEGPEVAEVFVEPDRARAAERVLDQVVEPAEPFVDPDVELDLVPGRDQDRV